METTFLTNFLSLPVGLGTSILFTLSIVDLAERLKLFDANNHLKQHLEKVCSLGGIAIFSAFWIAAGLMPGFDGTGAMNSLFAGSFVLFLAGVRDDLVGIPALKRLGIQIGVASLMFLSGVRLTYLPGFDLELPLWAGYLLTIGLIGAIVNAYNFIDGINGLAGGLAVIASLSFALFFSLSEMPEVAMMCLALAGAVGGFLLFNFGRAKIFMGDNGSTFIGIMLSYFTITFLQNHVLNGGVVAWKPVVVLAVMIVPLFDMVKVVVARIAKGKSPFMGDRTHIHHLLLNKGMKQESTCWLLYGWNVVVVILAVQFVPEQMIVGGLVLALIGSLPYLAIHILAKTKAGEGVRGGESVRG